MIQRQYYACHLLSLPMQHCCWHADTGTGNNVTMITCCGRHGYGNATLHLTLTAGAVGATLVRATPSALRLLGGYGAPL